MILKTRTKSVTHRVYELLHHRMNLSAKEKRDYENQVKGFEGELQFDSFMKPYHESGIVLNGLNLSNGDYEFQVDSCIVLNDVLYLYEVKNYSGSYYYKDGQIYSQSGYLLLSPLGQTDRSMVHFHNKLRSLGFRVQIKPYVVFVHPDFFVHSFPPNDSFLFPNQLHAHFKHMFSQGGQETIKETRLANQILALHNENYRPKNLPEYRWEDLRKGILCPECFSFEHADTRQTCFCVACGHKETIADAILRSAKEIWLLFSDMRLTTNLVWEWCGGIYSKERIRIVLKKNFQSHLSRRMTYYT
ncbi:nuclease-related domain-containing protein [Atopococcus tabaci]|uniref:nuclease-related domain-containing protein n=1 Tax=Atopococcus tabaci TaxID=269774 RepID=UPI00042A559D|nr:nuclease-related domain-containing protein [Atopococcus tabaci]